MRGKHVATRSHCHNYRSAGQTQDAQHPLQRRAACCVSEHAWTVHGASTRTAASSACPGKTLPIVHAEPTRAPRCCHLLCCPDASGMRNADTQRNDHAVDGCIFQKETRQPSNASAPSLAHIVMVTLHRSCATQQTCRSMRAPLPGHLPSSGAHSVQRRETRAVAMHSTISTQHKGENNTKKARVRHLPASQSTVGQPTHTRTITQMCPAVTVGHHAPPAPPPSTYDTAIQRPAALAYSSQLRTALHEARAPLRLPLFKQQHAYTQLTAIVTRQRQLPVSLASDNLSKQPGKSPR
ncbi:hypothetical protein, conserved in T. vivax [Trypanosoma vivax Y486]|uniref:Uncharacterized protein n=1 Tax=Trypanosoma vivax (strain Y486) TaxID=1055687 RepID=F9WKR6_TRYVY|nr:hypothetical protein, conserved in T. vivax [Trypanosoma vivax Y486]|eukprot:CCD18089.1 hypothetical protein, conserved in T. vivax [Trypanosoma vivax Y486]